MLNVSRGLINKKLMLYYIVERELDTGRLKWITFLI